MTRPPTIRSYRQVTTFGFVVLVLIIAGGCERISGIFGDRAKVQVENKARNAIDAYSAASEQANSAHRKVIEAFAKANGSRNLADYKTAMREQVIPRMTFFVERLEMIQAGTPELLRIHAILIAAYKKAQADIAKFVEALQSPGDLDKFNEIRKRLQSEVQHYRTELDAYYGNFSRKLRGLSPQAVRQPSNTTKTGT